LHSPGNDWLVLETDDHHVGLLRNVANQDGFAEAVSEVDMSRDDRCKRGADALHLGLGNHPAEDLHKKELKATL
jgi:hypothetical protein